MDVNQLMENVTFVAVHPDRIACYTEPEPGISSGPVGTHSHLFDIMNSGISLYWNDASAYIEKHFSGATDGGFRRRQ